MNSISLALLPALDSLPTLYWPHTNPPFSPPLWDCRASPEDQRPYIVNWFSDGPLIANSSAAIHTWGSTRVPYSNRHRASPQRICATPRNGKRSGRQTINNRSSTIVCEQRAKYGGVSVTHPLDDAAYLRKSWTGRSRIKQLCLYFVGFSRHSRHQCVSSVPPTSNVDEEKADCHAILIDTQTTRALCLPAIHLLPIPSKE